MMPNTFKRVQVSNSKHSFAVPFLLFTVAAILFLPLVHTSQASSIPVNNSKEWEGVAFDAAIPDPCYLEDVMCDTERIDEKVDTDTDSKQVVGYDISSYATLPTHEKTVKAIYDTMPAIANAVEADEYIRSKRPSSPVTGGMVERASKEYGVDMRILLALMQNDSAFGTAGLGARTHNPGNIANRDDGHTHDYGNWEDGVRGVARWVSKHEVK